MGEFTLLQQRFANVDDCVFRLNITPAVRDARVLHAHDIQTFHSHMPADRQKKKHKIDFKSPIKPTGADGGDNDTAV